LILSIGLCTSLVYAANNQSLEWGVSANQRFDYNLYVEHNSESIGYIYESGSNIRYYLVVESLPTIPDDIDHDDVPYAPQFDCYYLNGTEISFEFSSVIAWDARPIGNWDLLIDFWLDTPVINETDIINTQDLVGYNYTTSFENRTTLKTMLYSKVNGVLHTFRMGFFNETHPEYYSLREVTLVAGGDASVLYIGAAVGIAVVVVLVIFMRRR